MDQTLKPALIGLNNSELKTICSEFGEPSYRGRQIFQWLYYNRKNSISKMRNIPKDFRKQLEESYCIHPLNLVHVEGSTSEPTRKFLFELQTSEKIESVLMENNKHGTICISSQVGCAVDCKFCATATMGFKKNLSVGEIVDQFLQVSEQTHTKITNVVFMGMGEPFLNYERVLKAANLLHHESGINLGAGRITISTVGIVPKIIRFADERHRYKLAVSLNGSSQRKRSQTMPIANKYSMDLLLKSIDYYSSKSSQLVTLEYVLLGGVNDSADDAVHLLQLLSGKQCKVNLIPYNEIGGQYSRPNDNAIEVFIRVLKNAPFPVTVRRSKGTDISAGCGQLAIQERKYVR